jgi:hypothetical protein
MHFENSRTVRLLLQLMALEIFKFEEELRGSLVKHPSRSKRRTRGGGLNATAAKWRQRTPEAHSPVDYGGNLAVLPSTTRDNASMVPSQDTGNASMVTHKTCKGAASALAQHAVKYPRRYCERARVTHHYRDRTCRQPAHLKPHIPTVTGRAAVTIPRGPGPGGLGHTRGHSRDSGRRGPPVKPARRSNRPGIRIAVKDAAPLRHRGNHPRCPCHRAGSDHDRQTLSRVTPRLCCW